MTRVKTAAIYLGILALTCAVFLTRSQDISWAAPGQSPEQQTVPPRPPTPTVRPEPPPPPRPSPTPVLIDDDGNKDGVEPVPPLPTTAPNVPSPGTEGPTQPPEQDIGPDSPDIPGPEQSPSTSSPGLETGPGGEPGAPMQADLSLSKTADAGDLAVTEAVTFTVAVSNSGPGTATNVMVRDLLPGELILESIAPSQGHYRLDTGLWQVGSLVPGESVTLTLVTRLITPGTATNSAEIAAADQHDPDSIPGNGVTDEDDLDSAVVSALPAGSPTAGPQNDPIELPAETNPALSPSEADAVSYWSCLYALILGVLLVLIGLFLINRS